MDNLTKTFEGQEIKVKTDKGQTLINLASTAKVCGLINLDRGIERISWKNRGGVVDKLNKIYGANSPKEIKEEIVFTLHEIEESDDRNLIYISSWLSKRLATECNSQKAMEYKNFLVSLDEARGNKQVIITDAVDPQVVLKLAEGMLSIGDVVQGLHKSMAVITEYVKDSINSKDLQIEQTMNLIGFRAVNTKKLSDKLKEKLSDELGFYVTASSNYYLKAKKIVFKKFDVIKWEDIAVAKYNAVYAFIDGMEKQ